MFVLNSISIIFHCSMCVMCHVWHTAVVLAVWKDHHRLHFLQTMKKWWKKQVRSKYFPLVFHSKNIEIARFFDQISNWINYLQFWDCFFFFNHWMLSINAHAWNVQLNMNQHKNTHTLNSMTWFVFFLFWNSLSIEVQCCCSPHIIKPIKIDKE